MTSLRQGCDLKIIRGMRFPLTPWDVFIKGFDPSMRRGQATLLATAAMVLALSACAPRIDQRGNQPDEDLVAQINPGVDDKYRVAEILGSPSAITTFGDKTWYYISKRTETTAFFEPETVDQEVLEIRFDDQDIVESMRIYGPEDSREIALVERETPTEGNELTILQQLLGNLGRFNPTGDDAPAPY